MVRECAVRDTDFSNRKPEKHRWLKNTAVPRVRPAALPNTGAGVSYIFSYNITNVIYIFSSTSSGPALNTN